MPLLKKSNSKATSSRRQIAIKGVEGNILELPNNEFRLVVAASAINIELKSEAEQDAIIDTYQRFLNSLPCTIQIVEYIKEIDIEKYCLRLAHAAPSAALGPAHRSSLMIRGERRWDRQPPPTHARDPAHSPRPP